MLNEFTQKQMFRVIMEMITYYIKKSPNFKKQTWIQESFYPKFYIMNNSRSMKLNDPEIRHINDCFKKYVKEYLYVKYSIVQSHRFMLERTLLTKLMMYIQTNPKVFIKKEVKPIYTRQIIFESLRHLNTYSFNVQKEYLFDDTIRNEFIKQYKDIEKGCYFQYPRIKDKSDNKFKRKYARIIKKNTYKKKLILEYLERLQDEDVDNPGVLIKIYCKRYLLLMKAFLQWCHTEARRALSSKIWREA